MTDPRIEAITVTGDGSDVRVDPRPFEDQQTAALLLLWASRVYREALRTTTDDVPEAALATAVAASLAEVRVCAAHWLECHDRRLRRRALMSSLQEKQRDAARRAQRGDFVRASGDAPCACGAENREHPQVWGHEWLTLLCDGSLVKL